MTTPPLLGEKTPDYPHGYGFCQCGCGKPAEKLSTGAFLKCRGATHNPKHNPNQNPKPEPRLRNSDSAKVVFFREPDEQLQRRSYELTLQVHRLEKQLQRTTLEIEFAIAFVEKCWIGESEAKEILLRRLQALLPPATSGPSAGNNQPPPLSGQ